MTDLDEFRLIRPLGKGGMGMVYLAHDTVLDRQVAIKVIDAREPDAASRERFLTEARAIARLSHPNVVSIYRVGATSDGRPYLVQELVAGTSLDKLPRPMGWRQVGELALGITRGVAAAHASGILHRDIKPSNVMFGERGEVRILDFGIAKLSSEAALPTAKLAAPQLDRHDDPDATRDPDHPDEDAAANAEVHASGVATAATLAGKHAALPHTVTGALVGTPRYLAPELWRGEAATVRSDIYALGVTMYELLTGMPPFAEQSVLELERAVTTRAAPSIAAAAADVPDWLATIVDRCLAHEPAARWESAAELAYAIEQGLVGGPAIPDGNPSRGLAHFDATHRGVFFGRGADIESIVDRVRGESMVVITGDSGIGKSSLCRAGVIPSILAGALDARRWRVVVVSPGRRPMQALTAGLQVGAAEDIAALARSLVPSADDGLLVFVDQSEELITIADRDEAARAGELIGALADGHPNVRVLLAVRGDFLTRVAVLPGLTAPLTRGLHLLRPLTASDIREAIVGPARIKGVRFESQAMVDELVEAVVANPGALPLLQFTLADLWQRRDVEQLVIPAAALAELGGVDAALAGHADRVLMAMNAADRGAARQIVLRLVTDARTRAVRDRDELVGNDPIATTALESLVSGRLVVARDTVEGMPSYELAHEALIRSWGTLRDWLDAVVGEHAARNRLIASAGEWHRLGRTPELLWSRRQLDEIRSLDGLQANERDFVEASRALLRRRRVMRGAAITAVPLVALAIFLGVRFDAQRRRDSEIAKRVGAAATLKSDGDRFAEQAAAARTRAYEKFDARAPDEGEAIWDEARSLSARAHEAYRDAAVELEAAFLVDAEAVRAPMAKLLWAHAELAEADHDRERLGELLQRLAAYDPALRRTWDQPAKLVLEIDRPGKLSLHAPSKTRSVSTLAGGFDATPLLVQNGTRLATSVDAGSYLVVVVLPDGHVVKHPVLLGRGEQRRERLPTPRDAEGRAGLVYIPGGRFLYGSADNDDFRRDFLTTPPLHATHNKPFWISRTEVTFGQWIEYLRALPPSERERRRPHTEGNAQAMRLEEKAGSFVLAISPLTDWYRASEGEPLIYPDRSVRKAVRWEHAPVVGISSEDAIAYFDWLDRTGRVRGARLCSTREWEQAARGADGRWFPHGESLAPTDANFDLTYERKGFGLDEVGTFPTSDSLYGVADLAGNAAEMVLAEIVLADAELWGKGGNFYWGIVSARASANMIFNSLQRSLHVGIRICADAR